MVILRDDARVARLAKLGQYISFASIAILLGGLVLIFIGNENAVIWQLVALTVGYALSQVGMYLQNRYVREPRADKLLDSELKHVARDGRLYHFALPAPHVLLLPTGVVVLHDKYQRGEIYAEGDQWTQKGVGMRKYIGQEGLGNPTKEAERLIGSMANYIRKNAPEIEEVPMAPVIVFTSKDIKKLDVKDSRIPAMHVSKLKGFLRQQKDKLPPMQPEQYEALRTAFDKKVSSVSEDLELDAP
ncbi:MAG: NERD domain-containing protein [Candidatus Promineifilaceae bacterium]